MSKFEFRQSLKAMAVVCAAVGSMVAGQAQAVTLAELISTNGTITVGDKLFSDFAYTADGFTNDATGLVWGGTAADYLAQAALITVTGSQLDGNWGLDFMGNWHVNGATANANIDYKVTVLDPAKYLSDFHLDGSPSVIGASGQAQVIESVNSVGGHGAIPTVPNDLLTIYSATGVGTDVNDVSFTAAGNFPRAAMIETDIILSALPGSQASLGHVQESFSQSPVPEPSTYAMVLAGLAAVGVVARRNGKTA